MQYHHNKLAVYCFILDLLCRLMWATSYFPHAQQDPNLPQRETAPLMKGPVCICPGSCCARFHSTLHTARQTSQLLGRLSRYRTSGKGNFDEVCPPCFPLWGSSLLIKWTNRDAGVWKTMKPNGAAGKLLGKIKSRINLFWIPNH